jgi:2-polyprenyl-6-methoxyphenol hydroxylase-like FAD-dependent oxidoreductase
MNTGIGDSVNLGWKLAHVLQRRADPSLLDS